MDGTEVRRLDARALMRAVLFTLAYTATLVWGRLLVVPDPGGGPPVSLIAPSAGIALVWVAAARSAWETVLTSAAIVVLAAVVLALTDAPAAQVALVVLAPLQYVGAVWLMRRWVPHLWGAGGRSRMRTLPDLGLVLVAMAVAVLGYSVVRTLAGEIFIPVENLPLAVGRATRSFTAMSTIGLTGLLVGGLLCEGRTLGRPVFTRPRPQDIATFVVVAVGTAVLFLVDYTVVPRAPFTFVYVAVVAGVALRYSPTVTSIAAILVGGTVVGLTIADVGPLSAVPDPVQRSAVAQAFLVVLMGLGLVISLGRGEVLDSLATLERSEERVRRRAEELDRMMANLDEGIAIVEAGQNRIVHSNTAFRTGFGTQEDQWIERAPNPSELPPDRSLVRGSDDVVLSDENSPLLRALAGETVHLEEWHTTRPESPISWLAISATPLPPEPDGPARAMLVMRNISEQKAHADVLGQRAEELDLVFDNLRDGLAIVEEGGRYIQSNDALRSIMTGASSGGSFRGDVVPIATYHIHYPDGVPLGDEDYPYLRAIAGQTVREEEYHLKRPGEPPKVVLISALPLPTASASPRRAMVVVRDVTLERSYQDSLTQFARTVAHDLNNPLSVIDGWADAISEDLAESEDPLVTSAAGQMKYVRNGVRQMRDFITDLLAHAMASDQAIQGQPVELREIVEDIASQRTRPDLPDGGVVVGALPEVWADPVLVRQVLDNLIGNAVKYVAPGVTPRVHVEAGASVGEWVAIAVRDNGIGIHPAQRERVFENFHRASQNGYAGTGLGLGICKRIVERHGGSIRVEGNEGGGSTFLFTLPTTSGAFIAAGGR